MVSPKGRATDRERRLPNLAGIWTAGTLKFGCLAVVAESNMYKTEGIVLKEEDLGEADRIFSIFTKDFGKVRILGKGTRKIKAKLRAGLQPFHYIYLEFVSGKTFYIATEAMNIYTFSGLRNNLEKLNAVFYISDLLDKLVKEEKDQRIWYLISKILKKTEEPEFFGQRLGLLLRYFEWNLMDILGYHPQLYFCPNCQKKLFESKKLFFSAREGGILCQNCKNLDKKAKEIDQNLIKLLRLILERKKEILERLKLTEEIEKLKEISKYFLEFILEEELYVV